MNLEDWMFAEDEHALKTACSLTFLDPWPEYKLEIWMDAVTEKHIRRSTYFLTYVKLWMTKAI